MRLPDVFRRPWLAVVIALVGVVVSVVLRDLASALALADLAHAGLVALAGTVPLLAAAIVVSLVATSSRFAGAIGLSSVRLSDLGVGICAGLVMRALVEIVAPTTGSVTNPLGGGVALATVLSLLIAVAVSPVVEEILFRGVLQRALADGMRASGAAVATAVSIALTTSAFALAHVTTAQVQIGLLVSTVIVGLVCGLLTAMTGRLTAAITAHVVHNLIGAILLLV